MNQTTNPRNQSGVMLLEALIGILIFSIGILALLAMQATGMRVTVDAKYRSEASFLANEIIGTMWVDRVGVAATPPTYKTSAASPADCAGLPPRPRVCDWIDKVKARLPMDGTTPANTEPEIAINGRDVTVTVRWMRPGETTASNHTTTAQINDAI
jgi:type IV pilus assembly protein PilV